MKKIPLSPSLFVLLAAALLALAVPAVRTLIGPDEALTVRVILLPASGQSADAAPANAELCWRLLGAGEFAHVPLTPVARRLFRAQLPPLRDGTAIEYYLRATMGADTVTWPATAPALNQTVLAADVAGD